MICLQVMDTDSFTDLLSAAMSESGLTDLETSNNQLVDDTGSQFVHNSQPVVGIPTSQQLISVSVQPPGIQTNSIIIRYPQPQSPTASLQPAAIHTSAVTQKGVHKIVIRPMPPGVQQSITSRQLQPVVIQSTGNRQPPIQTNVTSAGQTSAAVVRPVIPVLRTASPHTGSSTIIRPQTAPFVSTVNIQSTAIRPSTLRFTAIPRQLAARLPSGESGLSLQIRPRLPVSTGSPRTAAAPASGSVMQPIGQTITGRPTLIQATVPSTAINLVPVVSSSLSATATVPVSTLTSNVTASVAQPAALSADGCVSCVVTVSCVSSVPVINSMLNVTASVSTGSTSLKSASTDVELSSMRSNMTLQTDAHNYSCSAVVSSKPLSSAEETRTGTVFTSSVSRCLRDISTGSTHTSTLISSESLTVTATAAASCKVVNADTGHVAAETQSASTTNTSSSLAEAETDEQQVKQVKMSVADVCTVIIMFKIKYFTILYH